MELPRQLRAKKPTFSMSLRRISNSANLVVLTYLSFLYQKQGESSNALKHYDEASTLNRHLCNRLLFKTHQNIALCNYNL